VSIDVVDVSESDLFNGSMDEDSILKDGEMYLSGGMVLEPTLVKPPSVTGEKRSRSQVSESASPTHASGDTLPIPGKRFADILDDANRGDCV